MFPICTLPLCTDSPPKTLTWVFIRHGRVFFRLSRFSLDTNNPLKLHLRKSGYFPYIRSVLIIFNWIDFLKPQLEVLARIRNRVGDFTQNKVICKAHITLCIYHNYCVRFISMISTIIKYRNQYSVIISSISLMFFLQIIRPSFIFFC